MNKKLKIIIAIVCISFWLFPLFHLIEIFSNSISNYKKIEGLQNTEYLKTIIKHGFAVLGVFLSLLVNILAFIYLNLKRVSTAVLEARETIDKWKQRRKERKKQRLQYELDKINKDDQQKGTG
ncbi:MAG: hypothetical protein IJY62_01325 [Clostridia bacterium]|nr:hypothetical protein [Clostridia bacterium]